ncbi:MAG: AglZ/HisF2 family acetamidino modification protein [Bacteroidia bacterium]|nr:AglZ/HisF2 family acetamidino modification protein [Bacteroidia bacterium]
MLLPRVIPVLLLKNKGLYKGIKFKNHVYVGDPINTVKIFNDKQVDELIILDIEATISGKPPDVDYISNVVSEAFMPVAYGGGIKDVVTAAQLFKCGVEKVVLNTAAFQNPELIKALSERFGSQSVVVCLDYKKNWLGKYECRIHCGTRKVKGAPEEWAKKFETLGAGELILNSIDDDGSMAGYNLNMIKKISASLSIPVVACGGAGKLKHLKQALLSGAHACAAGSMFVFVGQLRGILINYPDPESIASLASR